jgi:site-specific DNA-methyltransferase (adenine-specific)
MLPACYRCKSSPCVCKDGITLIHGDCRQVLPLIEPGSVDAVISDPPYGMGNNTDTTRFTGGNHKRGAGISTRRMIAGDDEQFDPSPWLNFPRVILWGANHFANRLPLGTTLVWLKRYEHLYGTFLSDGEVAWRKGGCGVYAFQCEWSGFSRLATDGGTVHPNQKPLKLMRWCIERAKVPHGGLILDPFAGSGTTLRAAKDLGRRCIGIEIEEKYCAIAANRLRQEVLFGKETPCL